MSKKKECFWTADGSHLPAVSLHTKAKHRVLEDYVEAWVNTLVGHGKFGVKTITIVDGFCGGGIYQDGDHLWEGSSLRIIRKVQEAFQKIKLRKPWQELDFEFIFIDKDKEHTACLELQLKNAGFEEYLKTGQCKIITGKFENKLSYCIERIQERRGYSFFFLDPFGLDVNLSSVRKILSLGRSEILLNYMLQGLVRLIRHRDSRYKKVFQQLDADDYYRDIPSTNEDFRLRQALLRDETLKLFRQEGQAPFAHTFALMNQPRATLYYLVHLSSNPTALSVMKEVTWAQNNLEYQYHYGIYGVGYRSLDALERNLHVYDIQPENIQYCVKDLSERIMEYISQGDEKDDLSFGSVYCSTFQENPATKQLYIDVINRFQDEGEIIAVRDGKETRSRRIQPKDILRKAKEKQLFFGINISRDARLIKRTRKRAGLRIDITPDHEQLNLMNLSDDE